jgi:hypothetical protein
MLDKQKPEYQEFLDKKQLGHQWQQEDDEEEELNGYNNDKPEIKEEYDSNRKF